MIESSKVDKDDAWLEAFCEGFNAARLSADASPPALYARLFAAGDALMDALQGEFVEAYTQECQDWIRARAVVRDLLLREQGDADYQPPVIDHPDAR